MFNRKLKLRIEQVDDRVRDNYWSLRIDLDRLVEALGMIKQETHRIEYIKKGGPEQTK